MTFINLLNIQGGRPRKTFSHYGIVLEEILDAFELTHEEICQHSGISPITMNKMLRQGSRDGSLSSHQAIRNCLKVMGVQEVDLADLDLAYWACHGRYSLRNLGEPASIYLADIIQILEDHRDPVFRIRLVKELEGIAKRYREEYELIEANRLP